VGTGAAHINVSNTLIAVVIDGRPISIKQQRVLVMVGCPMVNCCSLEVTQHGSQIGNVQSELLKFLNKKVINIVNLLKPGGFGLGLTNSKVVAQRLLADMTPEYSFTDITDANVTRPYGHPAIRRVAIVILSQMPQDALIRDQLTSHSTMSLSASLIRFMFSTLWKLTYSISDS
jgi:hypothetical protein